MRAMEIEVIEDKKNRLVFDAKGETHTIIGPLKEEMRNDDKLKTSGYHVAHPLINTARVVVETVGAEPRKVVSAAIKRLQKQTEKLKTQFKSFK